MKSGTAVPSGNTSSGRQNNTQPTEDTRRSASPWLSRLGLLLSVVMIAGIATIPLNMNQQFIFALAAIGLSLLIRPRSPDSRFRVMMLITISVIATTRYIYWRFSESLGWFDPQLELSYSDYFFSFGLLAAELYAWITLFLGYFQTLWPLQRKMAPLPDDSSVWPVIDVFIPTYNEPLDIVAPTILAARDIDYPKEKLNVYVLDDGARDEFADFSKQAGVHYIRRSDNQGAKAGNINHALAQTSGELVAIFDSDHIPVHSFLKSTVGWFFKDRQLGLLQTPHIFYSPDPIERNLDTYHKVPSENRLFYGLIQEGNDAWNASFFCGSCAVLRRQAIKDAGGISTESVTEDIHTSLRIQQQGWNSAYLNIPLAAGLATERLSDHIAQRTRWARGMVQILRLDNPLFASGLSLGQRLSYLNSSLHFLFSLPRIVFLTSPLAFLFFDGRVLQASAAMIAVYALHHLIQVHVTSSAMQSSYRHSFWAEVYETLLASKILVPTVLAFIFPRKPRFNVTRKGGIIDKEKFDWQSSKFIVFLLLMNLAGFVIGLTRLATSTASGDEGTLILTVLWTAYNCVILGAAVAVAFEHRQRRGLARLPRVYQVTLVSQGGKRAATTTRDISLQGFGLKLPQNFPVEINQFLEIELTDSGSNKTVRVPGQVRSIRDGIAGIFLENLTVAQMRELVHFTHSHNDAWTSWYSGCSPKRPLSSFMELLFFAGRGIGGILFRRSTTRSAPGSGTLGSWLFIVLLVVGSLFMSPKVVAAPILDPRAEFSQPVGQPASVFTQTRDLGFEQLGVDDIIHLRGGGTQNDIWFSLPKDEEVDLASLSLHFRLAPDLARDYRSMSILLNGQSVEQISIESGNIGRAITLPVALPARFVLEANQLSFRLDPRVEGHCPKIKENSHSAQIFPDSKITLQSHGIVLPLDLARLPAPFFHPGSNEKMTLPFIIPSELRQSLPALKAAGVLASWLGVLADYRHADFPLISDQATPERHAIVLALPNTGPEFIRALDIRGPAVQLIPNPDEKTGQLLVVMGRDADELLSAATALVSQSSSLSGQSRVFDQPVLVSSMAAYDSPLWLKLPEKTPLSALIASEMLTQQGTRPKRIDVDFRLPPDTFDWQQKDLQLPIVTEYEYRGPAPLPGSHLDIGVNNEWQDRVRLDGTAKGQHRHTENNLTVITGRHVTLYPTYKLPGRSQLSYYFDLTSSDKEDARCTVIGSTEVTTSIGPGSYLDLSGMQHYTRAPDLAKFANLGFPFTRHPDLAETMIILPDQPDPAELHLLLNTLGRFGGATGVPAYHVHLGFSDTPPQYQDFDYLILGGFSRQPELLKVSEYLPVQAGQGNTPFGITELAPLQKIQKWVRGEANRDADGLNQKLSHDAPGVAAIAGFVTASKGQHSGVVLMTQTPSEATALAQALISDDQIAGIHGDLALLHSQGIQSARILSTTGIGVMRPVTAVRWFFRNYPLALFLWMGVTAVFGAWMAYRLMERRAEWRLQGRETESGKIYSRN